MKTLFFYLVLLFFPRLWPCRPQYGCWESVLHGVCTSGHPPHPGDVPEPGRTHQHLRSLPVAQSQEMHGPAAAGGLHGQHGDHRLLFLHQHLVHRSSCLLPLWRLDLFPCLLLLFHHPHHHRFRGLRSPTEGQRSPEQPSLRCLQFCLYPDGSHGNWCFPQSSGATVHDDEHRGWEKRRSAEGAALHR